MASKLILRCGCAANATDQNGKPSCAVHVGLTDTEVEPIQPDLTGRMAKCEYCKRTKPSSTELAFFSHHPDIEYDSYYCGCRGWD